MSLNMVFFIKQEVYHIHDVNEATNPSITT